MEKLIVQGAPHIYRCEAGVLGSLEEHLTALDYHSVLVVHGKESWTAVQPYFPEFEKVASEFIEYRSECSLAEIDRIAQAAGGSDAIIGVGGGKILDLAKAAARQSGTEVVLVPTVASNCAAWTPLSVIYDNGKYIRFDIHPKNASLVLVEPEVLLHAPIDMLAAGIGDTIAKWYESDVQFRQLDGFTAPVSIAHYAARLCYDELLEHGEAAMTAARQGELNDSFIKTAETIIMTAGLVGGFSDPNRIVAAAHAVHNGLTVLDETHHLQHGAKVAYGILIQLVLEDRWEEADKLAEYFRQVDLPTSLGDLGIEAVTEKTLLPVAIKAAAPSETIHNLREDGVPAQEVLQAMLVYEKHISVAR
ncbi:iron-containing alcohol dehydrogenase family protein [Indiicoccus explosivorum]|uniref:iron-containing alcohol dehydrogenase family protein n=1 Tax=Indiicoccus explosivorum TaxID=1917864 RepID=UPI000B439C72|nr:iron-containing alcohol dehydrogenase family protein [Indiicoccus explosivorum]